MELFFVTILGRYILVGEPEYVMGLFKHVLIVLYMIVKSAWVCVHQRVHLLIATVTQFSVTISPRWIVHILLSSSMTLQSWLQPRIVSKSCKWMQLRYCLWSYVVQMEPYWIGRFCLPHEEGQNKGKFYYTKWYRDVFIKLMKKMS